MLQIIDALGEDLKHWGKYFETSNDELTIAGSSYGTILGTTFAAMFPQRVDRMMLDATVNSHEYLAGTTIEMALDADKAYTVFLEECIAAPEEFVLAHVAENAVNLSHLIHRMLEEVLQDKGSQLY